MKRIFIFTIIIFLVLLLTLISAKTYANTVLKDLSNNFFRLHILANSNSEEDQNLKLKIRDNILQYMNTLAYEGFSKKEAMDLTNSNINTFKEIAEKTIHEEGFDYPVNLCIGNFYFPTKEYANISLPAGFYDALKIEIGEAKGNNWWCSLFPPLCFVDISSGIIDESSENYLKENLSNSEFSIITEDSDIVKFKFKIIELLNQ